MNANYSSLIKILGDRRVTANVPLSSYSSMRIGGTADLFFKAQSKEDIIAALKNAKKLGIPYFLIGSGTNLIISDNGFRGLIIKNETSKIQIIGIRGKKISGGSNNNIHKVFIETESGVGMNRLVRFSLDQGLSGLESFLGQPGTVGGAVYINAHNMKWNEFFGEKIKGALLLDKSFSPKSTDMKYFKFGYDSSILQKTKEIVLSVTLELETADKDKLWQISSEVMDYRELSQPYGQFSAGCIFRNISKSDAIRIATPNFTTSAGYLLDRVGLKGYKCGNVMFSEKHTNFIVHKEDAKADDVIKLINIAKEKVKKTFGINLKEEVVMIGEFENG